jgi:hypothetical protein
VKTRNAQLPQKYLGLAYSNVHSYLRTQLLPTAAWSVRSSEARTKIKNHQEVPNPACTIMIDFRVHSYFYFHRSSFQNLYYFITFFILYYFLCSIITVNTERKKNINARVGNKRQICIRVTVKKKKRRKYISKAGGRNEKEKHCQTNRKYPKGVYFFNFKLM